MKTLFARLSIALLSIVAVTAGALFYVNLVSTRNYHEEITQRLNQSIAMYVTGQSQLISNGVVNQPALTELAERAMVINPTVEIYLLDPDGRILGHGGPQETLRTDRVDLAPVEQLLAGETHFPLRGTDPRSDRNKVFSSWPVTDNDRLQGYLYAILGGQKYDALASSLRGSYVQQVSLGAVLAVLATAFLVGLLVFSLLTRRLVQLTRLVSQFTESNFDPALAGQLYAADRPANAPARQSQPAVAAGGDEITRLHQAFSDMAGKILEQVEQLKETDRLRRELISNISHDLRTPLSSLHGYIETLLIKNDELDPAQRQQYLETSRKHGLRLEKLISDLFELSKLEAAAIKPQLEAFSLAELLHDVTLEFKLEAGRKHIDLRVEGDLENAMVHADISLVQRVLENLLRNAIRHTPEGGTVAIRIEPRARVVGVAVADTGCGIAEKDLERVFDRFYRSEQHDDPSDNSAGLGLAIVRKILDLHGSRITVSSRLNVGTTFAFELPGVQAA